jgi:hypothetical protein
LVVEFDDMTAVLEVTPQQNLGGSQGSIRMEDARDWLENPSAAQIGAAVRRGLEQAVPAH